MTEFITYGPQNEWLAGWSLVNYFGPDGAFVGELETTNRESFVIGFAVLAIVVIRWNIWQIVKRGQNLASVGVRVFFPLTVLMAVVVVLSIVSLRNGHIKLVIAADNAVFLIALCVGQWLELLTFNDNAATMTLRRNILVIFVCCMVGAGLFQPSFGLNYSYHGEMRLKGPWTSPNTFGLLMACGLLSVIGLFLEKQPSKTGGAGQQNWRPMYWFYIFAGGFLLRCLVKSYSRGAWLGMLFGSAYLIFWLGAAMLESKSLATSSYRRRCGEWLRKTRYHLPWVLVTIIGLAILSYWAVHDADNRIVRRFSSMGNANDFSWRNRLKSSLGALQMMADRPLFGWGWNQPEPAYTAFYKQSGIEEGAIRDNNYLMLGMVSGLPVLWCFLGYIAVTFRGIATRNTDLSNASNPQAIMGRDWLKATCRGASLILLIGLCFDKALFRIVIITPLWMFLGLGSKMASSKHTGILKKNHLSNVR